MDHLKTPLAKSLDGFAGRKIGNALALAGGALPASVLSIDPSGSIVVVKFELVTTPFTLPSVRCGLDGPEYIRYPIQVGCLGLVRPAKTYMQNINGLGTGTPDLTPAPNLTSFTFHPSGNLGWSAVTDPEALEMYGPNGVILRDAGSQTVITLTPDGITILLGGDCVINTQGNDVTVNGGGNVQVNDGGDVLAGAISLLNHTHSGVTRGIDDSGPPVP